MTTYYLVRRTADSYTDITAFDVYAEGVIVRQWTREELLAGTPPVVARLSLAAGREAWRSRVLKGFAFAPPPVVAGA